jgi:hypothetical protein
MPAAYCGYRDPATSATLATVTQDRDAHALYRLYGALGGALAGGPGPALAAALAAAPAALRGARAADVVLPWRLRGEAVPDQVAAGLAADVDGAGDLPAAAEWPELCEWADRVWGLAGPGLPGWLRDALAGRALDLARGVALRLLESNLALAALVPAARLLRWVAVLPAAVELAPNTAAAAEFARKRAVLVPEASFHLEVARRLEAAR